MFSIKPRLKKDISETFLGLGLHFSVSAFGLDLKNGLGLKNLFLDVLFQPWFNWKNFLFTLVPFFLTLFYNNLDNKILFLSKRLKLRLFLCADFKLLTRHELIDLLWFYEIFLNCGFFWKKVKLRPTEHLVFLSC